MYNYKRIEKQVFTVLSQRFKEKIDRITRANMADLKKVRKGETTMMNTNELFKAIEELKSVVAERDALKAELAALKQGATTSVASSNPFITHQFMLVTTERSLKDAIAAGKYGYADPDITAKKFPLTNETYGEKHLAIFHFNLGISSEDAVKKMDEAGYRPATLMELLALGEMNPDLQRQFPLLALGSSARWYDSRHVPVLGGRANHRELSLGYWDGDWRSHCRFPGVRK